jgi:hypothetical protein
MEMLNWWKNFMITHNFVLTAIHDRIERELQLFSSKKIIELRQRLYQN